MTSSDVVCTAHTSAGNPCKRRPIKGSNVCASHGGRAPQVRAAAERRILEAADPAAAKLVQLMRDPKVPPHVQLAAARDLLDRAGLAKTTEVQIALKPYEQDILGLLVEVEEDAAQVIPGFVTRSGPDELEP